MQTACPTPRTDSDLSEFDIDALTLSAEQWGDLLDAATKCCIDTACSIALLLHEQAKPFNMKFNRSVSAAIGEYFVLGELLKRNVEAYLAHGATQKSWDIAILTGCGTKRVQVKTIDWPEQHAVNGNFSGFDYLVVVLLNRQSPRSRFFVFNQAELDAMLSAPTATRGQARTLTMSQIALTSRVFAHEDNWKILIPPLQPGQDVLEPDPD